MLKTADPERYGTLSHPGDSFSFDIYSQVGVAMRERDGVDPLGGMIPKRSSPPASRSRRSAW